MMNPPVTEVVAITGTPGVGKSTVAEELKRRGYTVLSVNKLAEDFNCILGEENGCKVVDINKLTIELKKYLKGLVFLEGHLSHLLDPDLIIVLRCNPIELKRRLERKGWDKGKIAENVEAEIIDVILVEALDSKKEVYEIDTTELSPKEVADIIIEIVQGNEEIKEKYKPGKIDWIAKLQDKVYDLLNI